MPFYRYEGTLWRERNTMPTMTAEIDQTILYQNRQRDRAEEDINRDGKMDLWTFFIVNDGVELPSRIERDSKGNGVADTYEMFEPIGGTAVLVREGRRRQWGWFDRCDFHLPKREVGTSRNSRLVGFARSLDRRT